VLKAGVCKQLDVDGRQWGECTKR